MNKQQRRQGTKWRPSDEVETTRLSNRVTIGIALPVKLFNQLERMRVADPRDRAEERTRSKLIRTALRFLVGDIQAKGPIKGDPYILSVSELDQFWTLNVLRRLGYDVEPITQ